MMLVEDIREVEPNLSLETDLAIIGSGPAGLSIARKFIGSKAQVTILESGGLDEQPRTTKLNEIDNVGEPRHLGLNRVRNRVFGGSSHTWAGKCATFDEIDFEHRSWVPHSGWPISRRELEPYFDEAARLMHLGPHIYDGKLWEHLDHEAPDPDVAPQLLRPQFWQFSRSPDQAMEFLRFGPEFLKLEAPNVRILVNATVTHIDTDETGRQLKSLEVSSIEGKKITVKPKVAVLCAGAIENARLLLTSNRILPAGVGNGYDVVGRFLMDHPCTTVGEFRGQAARAAQSRLGLLQLRKNGTAHFYTHGLALSPDVQRGEGLLNCAVYLSEDRAADDPWDAMKRLYSRQSESVLQDAVSVLSAPNLLVEGLHRRVIQKRNVTHKLDKLAVDCLVEQVPDPQSRLKLSDRRDALGMPLPRLHWNIADQEKRSVMRLAKLVSSELARLAFEPPRLAGWIREERPDLATFSDMAHPTGTTRISDDVKRGVVDRNCQLHGVEGIYVAGSSVFPTAGHANPTLMIVAMASRLADWLKQRHFLWPLASLAGFMH